jgi:predicted  nucleic acid-binding Zn-ribbon protein
VSIQDTIRELEAREHKLHELLAEDTQNLRLARNQVARFEEMLQARLDEINLVRNQIAEAKETLAHMMK